MDNKEIAKKLGTAGGDKILKKYGTEHYRKMAEKRWAKKKSKTKNSSN